jgi:hypothetical protein
MAFCAPGDGVDPSTSRRGRAGGGDPGRRDRPDPVEGHRPVARPGRTGRRVRGGRDHRGHAWRHGLPGVHGQGPSRPARPDCPPARMGVPRGLDGVARRLLAVRRPPIWATAPGQAAPLSPVYATIGTVTVWEYPGGTVVAGEIITPVDPHDHRALACALDKLGYTVDHWEILPGRARSGAALPGHLDQVASRTTSHYDARSWRGSVSRTRNHQCAPCRSWRDCVMCPLRRIPTVEPRSNRLEQPDGVSRGTRSTTCGSASSEDARRHELSPARMSRPS